MRKKLLTVGIAAVTTLGAGAAYAQQAVEPAGEASWIHVRVDEADGAKVNLNLPISLVEVAVGMAGREGFDREKLRLEPHGDLSLEDLKRMWNELREAGDVDLVEVREGDEEVRVFRRGETVYVHVDEGEEKTVRIEIPASVVDALLRSEGEELDLAAAARELARTGNQEVVRIDGDGTSVRIWIDQTERGG